MHTPAMTIKYKGAVATDPSLAQHLAILGKGGVAKATEVELTRAAATKGVGVQGLHAIDVETKVYGAGTKTAAAKTTVETKSLLANGASVECERSAVAAKLGGTKGALGGTKGALGGAKGALSGAAKGTIWSGKGLSLGLGLGLGALGPVLALGALGLTAAGIYLYRKSAEEAEALVDELD